MKKYHILLVILLPLFISCLGRPVNAASYHVDLAMSSTTADMWQDGQWEFYSVVVGYHGIISANFTYTGDLDIDACLFLDIDEKPWDITREGIEKVPLTEMIANSQARGTNGVEEVWYQNNAHTAGMRIYILIYVYSGVGNSQVSINSNVEISPYDPGIGGFQGFIVNNIVWVAALFALAMAGLVLLMNHYRKKYKGYISEQKEKTAKEKLGHQAAKY